MEIVREIKQLQEKIVLLKQEKKSVGFVATMGYLHEGHVSLMTEAREDNDIVAASIFVNPLQFGPSEDFEEYPRDEERDIFIAEKAGVDLLFIPEVTEMYPTENRIEMKITKRVNVLCGRSRPGHFDGVITVLTKLFHIVMPNRTYFGLKDAQQVAVVDALITNLNFPIELVGVPTVREADGLAKSSRNVRLSPDEREEAKWLNRALIYGQHLIIDGENNPDIIVNEVKAVIEKKTSGFIDYVELLSYPALEEVETMNKQMILAIAVKFKEARLIDNLIIDASGNIVKHYK
ncbi:pantoate--beta-alanine ligase [Oceanobacillus sp. FSL H7-0719]|uniref:pantoate--beta-alanine ligase n=1 Tax=Oceanobacillus sp. FSL H7-0719 TaxID=2954507 RepID=UPI00324F0288